MQKIESTDSTITFLTVSTQESQENIDDELQKVNDFRDGNSLLSLTASKNNKKTQFNNIVSVILIPTSNDYKEIGLASNIWWTENELLSFKKNATEEIKLYINSNNNMNIKAAMRELYQNKIENNITKPRTTLPTPISSKDDEKSYMIENKENFDIISSSFDPRKYVPNHHITKKLFGNSSQSKINIITNNDSLYIMNQIALSI